MSASRNQSAERIAINTLLKNPKFKELTAEEKNTLLVAYARKFLSLLVGLLEMTLLKSISAERSIVF